jgi:two-component sensor histidine kinase
LIMGSKDDQLHQQRESCRGSEMGAPAQDKTSGPVQRSRDLARSNALLAGLSQVSTRIATTPDPNQVMETLGNELRALGLNCYVAELDQDNQSIIIRFISVESNVLELAEKMLGIQILGFRVPCDRWAAYEDLVQRHKPIFTDNLISMMAEALAIPRPLVTQVAQLTGASTDTPVIVLPLIITKQTWGMLVVWGADLWEEDVPALMVFAGQVAAVLESARLRTSERQRATDLTRSNDFITALSRVAARIGATLDLDEVLDALGVELKRVGITCIVALLEPEDKTLVIHYTSIESGILEKAQRLLGITMCGMRMPRERFPIWDEVIEGGRPVFVSDAVELAAPSMPSAMKPLITRVFRMGGWTPEDRVIWLPLSVGDQVRGGLAVWGPDLREDDLPTLVVFASQVGVTIESARLYAAERQRTQELAQLSEKLTVELAERRRAEEQVKASLQEKEVLLKEIHHRVKNNLQVVSSLLNLQSEQIQDPWITEAFRDSQNRVRSMALIHERLYQSENLAVIDFSDYVRNLAEHLLRSYGVGAENVALDVEADVVFLDIDTAAPCGLLLNELVSNALKHGFPDGRKGLVQVGLYADQDSHLTLTVSDDGIGFPKDADMQSATSLGLQLVHTLVQQLDGRIEIHSRNGTTINVTFPVPSQLRSCQDVQGPNPGR